MMFISSCILASGVYHSGWIAWIALWNIGWNCLGGGIQYLLPTMIEP